MPPFLMLILVAFAVLMVMFGENPLDQWREDQAKYGKDPVVRDINKFNEKRAKKKGEMVQYKPPPGSTTYRLPPDQAQIKPSVPFNRPGEENLVRPAPEVPIEQWGSPYPPHMLGPQNNSGLPTQAFPKGGGTSIVPGTGQ